MNIFKSLSWSLQIQTTAPQISGAESMGGCTVDMAGEFESKTIDAKHKLMY